MKFIQNKAKASVKIAAKRGLFSNFRDSVYDSPISLMPLKFATLRLQPSLQPEP